MKKLNFKETKFSQNINHFLKKEDGVYSILMAGMGVTLLAIISFAVDGSGIILDRARLSDSLEQASLAITAENNTFRKDKYQIKGSTDSFSQDLRSQRDKELVESYVKTYMPQIKDWTPKEIVCDQNLQSAHRETIKCRVSGTIIRPAWLPFKFANSADSNSDVSISTAGIAEKSKDSPPLDVMIVADLSGSMNQLLGTETIAKNHPNNKINTLKRVLNNLTDNVLFKDKDSKHRIGITSFGFGAQYQRSSCALPYQFKDKSIINQLTNLVSVSRVSPEEINKYFAPSIDFKKTVDQISQFDGSTKPYSVTFRSNPYCLGATREATSYWYGKDNHQEFKNFLANLEPAGATLSSSGLLVAANLMMDKQKQADPNALNSNTQRTIIILSDGKDELIRDEELHDPHEQQLEQEFRNVTNKLIDAGVCEAIRNKLDGSQNSNYSPTRSKLAFIAFGYDPSNTIKASWEKCVGKENYFTANEEKELAEAFEKAFTPEEVGHSLNN